jgi:large subunit ribosomal protein L4
MVLDNFDLEEVKTKKFAEVIKGLGAEKSLIVIDDKNRNLELSARNVPGSKVLSSDGLNVYDILKYDKLILLSSSVEKVEGRFA